MIWELARYVGAALLAELGERVAQLLFYENEGNAIFFGEASA